MGARSTPEYSRSGSAASITESDVAYSAPSEDDASSDHPSSKGPADTSNASLNQSSAGTFRASDPTVDKKFIDFFQEQSRGRSLVQADPDGLLLRSAVCTNRHALVHLLATHGANVETVDLEGHTALHIAAGRGHAEVVSTLLDLGVKTAAKDKYGRTPLWWAAHNGHSDAVATLLEADEKIDLASPDTSGCTVLAASAANGHVEVLRTLIWGQGHGGVFERRNGLQIGHEDAQGRTAMSWAAGCGHEDVVHQLLVSGAGSDIQDMNGWSPAHWAAARGQRRVISILDSFGADLEAFDVQGRTPLSWAAANGHAAVVKEILIATEESVDFPDDKGRTPLSLAAECGHLPVVQNLLAWAKRREAAKYESLEQYQSATPLSFALEAGMRSHVAEALAEHGLEIDFPDSEGRTSLSWAVGNGHKEVAQVLIEHGAETESLDFEGRTPLSWAAESGHLSVVEMLLDSLSADIDIHRQDESGQTALSRARLGGFTGTVNLLESIPPNPSKESKRVQNYDQLLLWAVKEGHIAAVELLLREGANPDAQFSDATYLLGWAAFGGNVDIARLLIDAGATVDAAKDGYPVSARTPLFLAATSGQPGMVDYLVSKGADINWRGGSDYTPLAEAVKNGHGGVVAKLLQYGAELVYWPRRTGSWTGQSPYAPLELAVDGKSAEISFMLIDHAIEALNELLLFEEENDDWHQLPASDYPDHVNRTCTLLSYAVQTGYISGVERLLSTSHVDVNHAGYHWQTPLASAAKLGDGSLVSNLINHGASLDNSSLGSQQFFEIAYDNGHRELAAHLLDMWIQTMSEQSWDANEHWYDGVLTAAARVGNLAAVKFLTSRCKSLPDLSGPSRQASTEGHLEILEYLLGLGANFTDRVVLSTAALHGHESIVRFLLERKTSLIAGMAVSECSSSLSQAVKGGHLEIVRLLLKYGADADGPQSMTASPTSSYEWADEDERAKPLTTAAYYGHLSMVELLLTHGANPKWGSHSWFEEQAVSDWQVPDISSDKESWCALMGAIVSGHKDIVSMFLSAGADAGMGDRNILLAWAAMCNRAEIANLLIDWGCGFDLKYYGETVLSVASRYGSAEVVKVLIERGANIESKDRAGRSPLSLGADVAEVVNFLIEAGADPNSKDNDGRSPLRWTNNLEIMKTFLKAKADPDTGQSIGQTPLIEAVEMRQVEHVRLLLEAGADVNARDAESCTPLLVAAKERHSNIVFYPQVKIVELLLDHGADTEARDLKGLTALSWAAWRGNMAVVRVLLKAGASMAGYVGKMPVVSTGEDFSFGWIGTSSDVRYARESDSDSGRNEDSNGSRVFPITAVTYFGLG